jgi:hypothetical protein
MSRLVGRKLQVTLGEGKTTVIHNRTLATRSQHLKINKVKALGNKIAIPITGALCCSLNFRGLLLLNPLIAALGWQVISKFQSTVLFEKKESEALGETTVLQNRIHTSQEKLFDLLGTHCPPSTVANFFPFHSTQFGGPTVVRAAVPPVIKCIESFSFIAVWSTSRGIVWEES